MPPRHFSHEQFWPQGTDQPPFGIEPLSAKKQEASSDEKKRKRPAGGKKGTRKDWAGRSGRRNSGCRR